MSGTGVMINLKKNSFVQKFLNVWRKESLKKYGIAICVILILALLLEVFVFNYKYFNSMLDKEQSKIGDIKIVSGLNKTSDTEYTKTTGDAVIEVDNIDAPIKYLGFDLSVDGKNIVDYTVSATDEANGKLLSVPSRSVTTAVERSKYPKLHFSGNVKKLQIKFSADNNKKVIISELTVNKKVPMMFSFGRFMFIFLLLMLLFMLRPKSFLWYSKIDFNKTWQRATIITLIVAIAAGFYPLATMDPFCIRKNAEQEQYSLLAKSIIAGKTYIAEEKDSALLNMENPYDRSVRGDKLGRWDNAYYNGKYYVYFGVAPVLIYYIPYYLITHKDLPNNMAVYISCLLAMIGIFYLLRQIQKRWFKNAPFGLYIIVSLIFIFGCGIVFTVKRPDFYPLPIITGMMFAIWGLSLWISAKQIVQTDEDEGETQVFVPWRLALGSVCMALVVACRPQIFLVFIIGIILFWNDVFKTKQLFSKSSVKQTLAICLPFVIIGGLIMWYNAIRFGSPFDFGANYNLTSNDMTKRGFVFGRIGLGIFTYLFQTPQTTAVFPFLNIIDVKTSYLGLTIYEKFFGGAMMTEPFLWIGLFAIFKNRKQNLFESKKLYRITIASFLVALLIVILDTQMAGILRRYFGDFLWMMYLGGAISAFAVYDSEKYNKNSFIKILIACFVLCIVFHGLEIFVDTAGWGIIHTNEVLYQKMQYLIAFWM